MSSSLGEKLRQAREERGISISEVAEQTRISPLYLEAIDGDNYKTLPGGIFNKGFVRSYAKYVGIDEQEALQDYSRLMVEHEEKEDSKYQSYRPEVLTDDRTGSSIIPTVIFAVVILGLMTAGILFLVNYIQNQQSTPQVATNTVNLNTAPVVNNETNSAPVATTSTAPTMGTVKVEFTAVGDAVSLTSVTDSGKSTEVLLAPGNPVVFEPKESLKLRYSKSRAQFAQLKLNGKQIVLPSQPANPKASTIEIDINQGNLAQVWQSGTFASGTESAPSVDANATPVQPVSQVPARPTPKAIAPPKPVAANTGTTDIRPASTPVAAGKPAPTPIIVGRPASNVRMRPNNN